MTGLARIAGQMQPAFILQERGFRIAERQCRLRPGRWSNDTSNNTHGG